MADISFNVTGKFPPFMVFLLDSNDDVVLTDDGDEGFLIQDENTGMTYTDVPSGNYKVRSYDTSRGLDEFDVVVP